VFIMTNEAANFLTLWSWEWHKALLFDKRNEGFSKSAGKCNAEFPEWFLFVLLSVLGHIFVLRCHCTPHDNLWRWSEPHLQVIPLSFDCASCLGAIYYVVLQVFTNIKSLPFGVKYMPHLLQHPVTLHFIFMGFVWFSP
jgi:hypothetical protein